MRQLPMRFSLAGGWETRAVVRNVDTPDQGRLPWREVAKSMAAVALSNRCAMLAVRDVDRATEVVECRELGLG